MRFSHLVWKELWHRRTGSLAVLLGIALCIGLVVSIQLVSLAARARIRRVMASVGKNILILPKPLTMDRYLARDFGDATFPQTYPALLNKAEGLPAGHFSGSLQRRIVIDGEELILCGITAEPSSDGFPGRRALESGEAELGALAARRLGFDDLSKMRTLVISPPGSGAPQGGPPRMGPPKPGRPGRAGPTRPARRARIFKVARIHEPTATLRDDMVFVDLGVAQEMLDLPDRINVIEGMSYVPAAKDLPALTKRIQARLSGGENAPPVANVYHRARLARARAKARASTVRNTTLLSALALVCGMLVIGGYSVWDARRRRREMGVLLAIAARPKHVAWMFIQKMLLLGLLGGVLGCVLGGAVAARRVAREAALPSADVWAVYAVSLGLALVLTVVPSLLGVRIAAHTDPAETLREL